MFGGIIGDYTGSIYEYDHSPKEKEFLLWQEEMMVTDDSILTVAIAEVLTKNFPIDYSKEGLEKISKDCEKAFFKYYGDYPMAGYGGKFSQWIFTKNRKPYNSWGNGSAMRVSSVGWMANSEEEVKLLSNAVTALTHNHPEGLKGAEATAMCIYLLRKGKSKEYVKEYVKKHYYPQIDKFDYEKLVMTYYFDPSCQGTVPQAIFAFLISNSFEDCLRTAVSIGGDCDTLTCIACSIAEAHYGIPFGFLQQIKRAIPRDLTDVILKFEKLIKERDNPLKK